MWAHFWALGVLTGQLALAFFSISLAFLSSSQVWELTILNKINDLILSIQLIVLRSDTVILIDANVGKRDSD